MLRGRELSQNARQYDSLDGLRGLAVLLVFLSHTSNDGTFLLPFANFSGVGKSGVFLFFVLSSFLLTGPFIRAGRASLSRPFLSTYAVRRFFRVYPLYSLYLLLALATSIAAVNLLGRQAGIPFFVSVGDFFDHLALNQGKGVTWSILVEFRFYFVLPILAWLYAIVLRARVAPTVGVTLALVVLGQLIWPQSQSVSNDIRMGYYLPLFFLGSVLAVIHHRWENSAYASSARARRAVETLGILALVALVCLIPSVTSAITGRDIPRDFFHQRFISFGVLWSLVLFACIAGAGWLRRLFAARALRYLGFISFSVYLLHVVVIGLVNRVAGTLPMKGWAMLAATIAVSHVTWVLVERPTSRIRLDGLRLRLRRATA